MKNWLLSLVLLLSWRCWAQDSVALHRGLPTAAASRKWVVGSASAAAFGGSFTFLSAAWYKDYPKTGFHTFNDGGEWMQMDKVGHAWTTYHTSRLTTGLWQWSGLTPNQALAAGTGSSLLYMLSIEYLDGRSADWGWSWADVGANVLGASLFATQQLAWKDQPFTLKFSAHRKRYNDGMLQQRADALFGRSFTGRLLKDYNAQTYWLSANVRFLLPDVALPSWFNVAVGYGADGMFGGFENIARDKSGNLTFDRRDIRRYRQWYLAPDIDFTRIKTKSRFIKTALSALNVLKFPAPAVVLSKGKVSLQAVAY